MTNGQAGTILRHIRKLVRGQGARELADGALLQRFVADRDEAAFATLLRRHGELVWGVCRRVLGHEQDAEDAFQATFLVLARKADSIHKDEALAAWLYGVAYRTAMTARKSNFRRRQRERQARVMPRNESESAVALRELQIVLDDEVSRLPAKYQSPFVLCCLQGKSRPEAARELGWKLGTVSSRLAQARKLLQQRLTRRGVTLSGVLAATALTQPAGSAAVPAAVFATTVRAAAALSAGKGIAAGVVSVRVAALVEGGLKTMFTAKQIATALVLALGMVAGGAGLVLCQSSAAPAPDEKRALQPEQAAKRADQTNAAEVRASRTDRYGDPLPEGAIARLGTIRFRPGGHINSIAFTPDGKHLVSHGYWSGVNVWDAATGKELRRLTPDANDWIGAALLTPDGQSVVTLELLNQKHFIRMRDLAELKVTRAFPVSYLYSPCLTPDGKFLLALASNGNDITVEVWNLQEGKQVRSWNASTSHVWTMELSGDGKTLATGGTDKTIRVWDVATGKQVREFDGSPNVISKVALSRDGAVVASLGSTEVKHGAGSSFPWTNRIRIWDVTAGKELRQLQMDAKGTQLGDPPAFSMVTFAPDGKTLLTAGNDGVVRLWDPATGKEQRLLARGNRGLTTLAFTADSKTVAVAGSSIRLIDLATGKDKLPAFERPQHAVGALPVAPDGRTAATINEGLVQLWDATTGRPRDRIGAAGHAAAGLRPSADGRTLITLGGDMTLRVWDLTSGKERRRFDVPKIFARANSGDALLAVTPDGATVVLMNADKSLRVLDLATGKDRLKLPGSDDWIYSAALTSDGRTLIVCYGDHTAHVWDVKLRQKQRQFSFAEVQPFNVGGQPVPPPVVGPGGRTGWAYAAAASPDGRLLAYGSQANYLAIHDVATGKTVRLVENLTPDGAGTLAFSPDGRTLAWSGWRQPAIHLLEVASGKERYRFDGHKGRVTSLAFSADGRTLISGSEDTTALVWDLSGKRDSKAHPITTKDLDACWNDLTAADAARAYQSMRRLITSTTEAVPYLRKHLTPVAVVQEKRLAQLIADLDNNKFAVREQAAKELDHLGEAAVGACRKAPEGQPSAEVRRRLESLLEKQAKLSWNPSPDRLRALRAVEVLERMGTSEAQAVLEALAKGAPEARLTQEAKAALERLAKRSTVAP